MGIAVLVGAELKLSVGTYTYKGNADMISSALMQSRKERKRMMKMIKQLNEKDRLEAAWEMLQNAHKLYGIQCQNCNFYKPDPEKDGYKGKCVYADVRDTYWNQYCDDFDGWHNYDDEDA